MKKQRILHICDIATCRVMKQVIAQQLSGRFEPTLLHSKCWHKDLLAWVNNISIWGNPQHLQSKLERMGNNYDAYHVHTALGGSQIIELVRVCKPKETIIWDLNDFNEDSPQYTEYASHIFTPSHAMTRQLDTSVPFSVIYSMVPKALFPMIQLNHYRQNRAGVLESGIGTDDDPVWRDYRHIANNLGLFIMAGNYRTELSAHYNNILQALPYTLMLRALTRYTYGYAGAANDKHEIHDCVTNKLWEYIAAGIPVVTFKSLEMTELMNEIQWPYYELQSQDDVPWSFDGVTDHREYPFDDIDLKEIRYNYTMDKQLGLMSTAYHGHGSPGEVSSISLIKR